jgi:hypothetical protein
VCHNPAVATEGGRLGGDRVQIMTAIDVFPATTVSAPHTAPAPSPANLACAPANVAAKPRHVEHA